MKQKRSRRLRPLLTEPPFVTYQLQLTSYACITTHVIGMLGITTAPITYACFAWFNSPARHVRLRTLTDKTRLGFYFVLGLFRWSLVVSWIDPRVLERTPSQVVMLYLRYIYALFEVQSQLCCCGAFKPWLTRSDRNVVVHTLQKQRNMT
jgi:hypothetical protein